jgi:hypothetical protein
MCHVEIESGSKPLQDGDTAPAPRAPDRAARSTSRRAARGQSVQPGPTTQITEEGTHVDADHRAAQPVIPGEHVPQTARPLHENGSKCS